MRMCMALLQAGKGLNQLPRESHAACAHARARVHDTYRHPEARLLHSPPRNGHRVSSGDGEGAGRKLSGGRGAEVEDCKCVCMWLRVCARACVHACMYACPYVRTHALTVHEELHYSGEQDAARMRSLCMRSCITPVSKMQMIMFSMSPWASAVMAPGATASR